MVELDGIEYTIQTPEENAAEIVEYINNYCANNNVQNIYGETVQISTNLTNPLYMIIYGLSYLITICQKLIYSAGCSNSIASSSDRQLLNIAEEANIKRKSATQTTITCTIYSTEDGPCTITTDLATTVLVGTESVVFYPAYEVVIPADLPGNTAYATVIFTSEEVGSWTISAGAITAFDTPVENLSRIVSQASVPGRTQETIAELRQRLYNRSTGSTQLDKCMDAMLELPGITMCNIYFNYSSQADQIVAGVTVPPRQAALFIQGYSDQIAETFYNYLICNCAGSNVAGAIEQKYTTRSGQELSVYIIPPSALPLYVRVYINQIATPTIISNVQTAVMNIAASITIGQDLSTADVLTNLVNNLPTIDSEYVQLSTDNVDFSYRVTPSAGQILTFSTDNIEVIGTE